MTAEGQDDLPRRVPVEGDAGRAGLGEHRRGGAGGEVDSAIVSFKRPRARWDDHHGMHAIAAIALAIFLISVGIGHFLVPGYFRSLVPSWLGRAGLLVAVGGVAEIVIGAVLLAPRGREAGGWAAAALITVYLVCHLDALVRASGDRPRLLDRPVGVALRLAVNLAYIGWALAVALTAT
jgi:uncharacterized membrane protein